MSSPRLRAREDEEQPERRLPRGGRADREQTRGGIVPGGVSGRRQA